MTDQTISELLVLFLLAIACARIFFHTQVKSDTLSVLPLVAFCVSILAIVAWGLSLIELVNLILSFFITLWNIRALLRLNAQLVIDHYGPLFVIVSIFNLVLVFAVAIVVLICRPVKVDAKKANVTETVTSYSGTFSAGFTKTTIPFQKANARLWKYEALPSETAGTKHNVILFIADNCASPTIFRPFFIRLAHDGYTVYTAEFYANDMAWLGGVRDFSFFRRISFCEKKLLHPEEYNTYKVKYAGNMTQQYKALIDLTYPELSLLPPQETIVLAGDELALQALPLAAKQNADIVDGTCNIASIDTYTAGYGPVEQTDPLLAVIIGRSRDASLFISAHTAIALEKAVDSITSTKLVERTTLNTSSTTQQTPSTEQTVPSTTTAVIVTPAKTVTSTAIVTPVPTPNTATRTVSVPATTTATTPNISTPATTTATTPNTSTPATNTATTPSTSTPATPQVSVPTDTTATTQISTPATPDTTTTPAQQPESSPTPEQSQ